MSLSGVGGPEVCHEVSFNVFIIDISCRYREKLFFFCIGGWGPKAQRDNAQWDKTPLLRVGVVLVSVSLKYFSGISHTYYFSQILKHNVKIKYCNGGPSTGRPQI